VRRWISSLAIILAGGVVWIWRGPAISAVVDRWLSVGRKRLPASLTYDGGGFRTGNVSLTFAGIDNLRRDLAVRESSSGYAMLVSGSSRFPLGVHLAPDPGDEVSLEFRRGVLGWPAWKDFSILGCPFPFWRRYCFYALNWKKESGAALDMQWRYEQTYYSRTGWSEPLMMWNSRTGLTSVSIENPCYDAVARYIEETRHWKPEEYRIEQNDEETFAVVHRDDGMAPGAGKSVIVTVSRYTGKVTGETGWQ
jgi:hypothetical protein